MKTEMANHTFVDVEVPLLWGARALIQDPAGKLSIINLPTAEPTIEVLADEPAPGTSFIPLASGFKILAGSEPLYRYNPEKKRITALALNLPEIELSSGGIRVGSASWFGNTIAGGQVGIAITQNSVSTSSPLPPGLARLRDLGPVLERGFGESDEEPRS